MLARTSSLLATSRGRRWGFTALYLSEGAPVGFVWWAMPGLLLTTFATLPWILKFLVAPAIDSSLARRVSLKRWIITCQLAMAATIPARQGVLVRDAENSYLAFDPEAGGHPFC